ncbi:hypothetical protein HOLleu_10803 [Holothuria leucospilota]|uniref:Uncharacterized protein n=1 Tax=Holothuria leucospilota TaxID=206669 RepID=A0A9Q1CFM9_HOLLE|nr:hypothetical protein HOLleu_10803 [Holothuria leucospilota]
MNCTPSPQPPPASPSASSQPPPSLRTYTVPKGCLTMNTWKCVEIVVITFLSITNNQYQTEIA